MEVFNSSNLRGRMVVEELDLGINLIFIVYVVSVMWLREW